MSSRSTNASDVMLPADAAVARSVDRLPTFSPSRLGALKTSVGCVRRGGDNADAMALVIPPLSPSRHRELVHRSQLVASPFSGNIVVPHHTTESSLPLSPSTVSDADVVTAESVDWSSTSPSHQQQHAQDVRTSIRLSLQKDDVFKSTLQAFYECTEVVESDAMLEERRRQEEEQEKHQRQLEWDRQRWMEAQNDTIRWQLEPLRRALLGRALLLRGRKQRRQWRVVRWEQLEAQSRAVIQMEYFWGEPKYKPPVVTDNNVSQPISKKYAPRSAAAAAYDASPAETSMSSAELWREVVRMKDGSSDGAESSPLAPPVCATPSPPAPCLSLLPEDAEPMTISAFGVGMIPIHLLRIQLNERLERERREREQCLMQVALLYGWVLLEDLHIRTTYKEVLKILTGEADEATIRSMGNSLNGVVDLRHAYTPSVWMTIDTVNDQADRWVEEHGMWLQQILEGEWQSELSNLWKWFMSRRWVELHLDESFERQHAVVRVEVAAWNREIVCQWEAERVCNMVMASVMEQLFSGATTAPRS